MPFWWVNQNQTFRQETDENNGLLLISPAAHQLSLQRMGIVTDKTINVGSFNDDQKHFLNYHREEVFLEAKVNR
ncbi:MAG: hypothetical protein JXA04_09680 [Gammaproteobacteria bacterium]|nr:hypothetical protein [Gammaproteobacteria bacterium]